MSEYIQSIDGMNSGEFDTLFVDDLTANTALFSSAVVSNNLTVQGDLIVEGDQIFTGNQTIEGSLTVEGTGTFSGPLTSGPLTVNGAGLITGTLGVSGTTNLRNTSVDGSLTVSGTGTFSGPTKVQDILQTDSGIIARGGAIIESYLTSKNIASFDNQETKYNLDVGSNAPFFEILLSPSAGIPTPSGSWTYNLTSYYSVLSSGYDFDFMIATTGGPASTPLILEVDVNGDIVDTKSLFIPRNGLLKVRLPLDIFQAGANNVFLNLATATSGPNWASFFATLWSINAPDLPLQTM
jgi:cytoskeletal protein CcmA (bactofilin family)